MVQGTRVQVHLIKKIFIIGGAHHIWIVVTQDEDSSILGTCEAS